MKKVLNKISTVASLGVIALSNAGMAFAQGGRAGVNMGTNTIFQTGGTAVTSDPTVLIKNVVNLILILAGALVFAYLIWGAIKWITSGGDKSKVEEARNKITSAIVGLLILAAVWAIFNLVLTIAFGAGDMTIKSLNTAT